jgi:hypothetical protein
MIKNLSSKLKIYFSIILLSFSITIYCHKKNYWECDTHPKVVCKNTQTCCKQLINDQKTHKLFTSYECFDGINKICCGDKGICKEDEYCNPNSNMCEKVNFTRDYKSGNFIANKNFEEDNLLKIKYQNQIQNDFNSLFEKENSKTFSNKERPEYQFFQSKDIYININDIINLNHEKILQNIPLIVSEFKSLNCNLRNFTIFMDGYMSGLSIFEKAYRNTTCENNIKKTISDLIVFFDFIKTINFDREFFKKLNEAVSMMEDIYKDYRKQTKECIITYHKIFCILNKVFDKILDPYFSQKLVDHTYCNYHELENRTRCACRSLQNHEFYQAGFKFGDLTKFFAFWDFIESDNPSKNDSDNNFRFLNIQDLKKCGIGF